MIEGFRFRVWAARFASRPHHTLQHFENYRNKSDFYKNKTVEFLLSEN